MIGVDGTSRDLAIDNCLNLTNGFERLAFDRRRRQPADVRGRDDIWQFRQLRGRHLVAGAADIYRRSGDAVLAQRSDQRGLVDEIAARQIDKKRVRPHARQGCLPDQTFGLFIRHHETNDVVGAAKKVLKRHMFATGDIATGERAARDYQTEDIKASVRSRCPW